MATLYIHSATDLQHLLDEASGRIDNFYDDYDTRNTPDQWDTEAVLEVLNGIEGKLEAFPATVPLEISSAQAVQLQICIEQLEEFGDDPDLLDEGEEPYSGQTKLQP